jgi:hypothetical protein
MNHVLKTLYFLCAGMVAAGCAGVGIANDHIRWTEEVKLSDGKVIQIQRHVELTESGFPVQRKGFYKYHEICYPPMGIHWKSRPGYQPDIFDIVDGKAYMHVPVGAQHECEEQGKPSPNALYFVWEDGKWKRISREEFPAASQWNLTLSASSNADAMKAMNNLVPWEEKFRKLEDSLYFEQKRLGWKRINESYAQRAGCARWGKTSTELKPDAVSIFVNDGKNTCKP